VSRQVSLLFGEGGRPMWLSESQLSAASVPELLELLDSPHYGRRAQAARELANRKEQPALVWPRLAARHTDETWMVRMQIPRAAIHLGIPAERAVPLLRELLGDEDEVVRGYAAWALRRLGETEGVPPEDDSPPELVVHGEVPELRGQVCQEFIIQQLWCGDEIADEVSSVWMRFAGQWYRVQYDCILYWEARDRGPEEGPWGPSSEIEYRLVDLAGELSLREVRLTELAAEAKAFGAVIRFGFTNGVGLEFEADIDEMVYRRTTLPT
jgi:hypothetical protein